MNPNVPAGTAALAPADSPGFAETYRSCSSEPSAIEVSLIVPAFNEADRLQDGMERFWDAVTSGSINPEVTEVLFIDDGSVDETADRARRLLSQAPHVRVLRLGSHTGKGGSIRLGVGQARGRYVAFVDADMAILPSQLPDLLHALDHADVAIGSREIPGSEVNTHSVLRSLGGRSFNRVVNLLTHVGLTDTQCGFKAFRTPAARLLFHLSVIDGFAFDVEVLHIARRLGLRIEEVPVRWRRIEGSRIHPIRDPSRMLLDVAAVRAGIRRPPQVPALVVPDDFPPTALGEAVERGTPVVRCRGGGALLLLPRCGATAWDAVEERAGERCPGGEVRRVSLSPEQLMQMAPLSLISSTRP